MPAVEPPAACFVPLPAGTTRTVPVELPATAFRPPMVRNIVGTLAAVGRGDRPAEWVAEVLAGRNRCVGGATAPSEGLYLVQVDYGPAVLQPPGPRPGPLA